MHTHYKELKHTWTMPIDKKHYIRVFIWKDKKSLETRLCLRKTSAYAVTSIFATRQSGKTSKNLLPRKFGEMHFHMKAIGSGVVAHELQHMMNYWINAAGWNISAHDERIAYLAGDLANNFWKNWYLCIGDDDDSKQTKIMEGNFRETSGKRAYAIIRCFCSGSQPK